MSLPDLTHPLPDPNNMKPALMKPTENGSYALLNQALTPRQTHHLHPCWSARSPPPPSSPVSDLCSPDSINCGSIRASPHASRLKVKVRWAPQVGRWRLRSQGWMPEPSNFRRLDRMWDLCDKLPKDVSRGDGLLATWLGQLHVGHVDVSLRARKGCPTRLVPANQRDLSQSNTTHLADASEETRQLYKHQDKKTDFGSVQPQRKSRWTWYNKGNKSHGAILVEKNEKFAKLITKIWKQLQSSVSRACSGFGLGALGRREFRCLHRYHRSFGPGWAGAIWFSTLTSVNISATQYVDVTMSKLTYSDILLL